jgi:putative PIG3 family NAD(P)H quinone oxidoreductase
MKAIIVRMEKKNPILEWKDARTPEINSDTVRVDVKATAVNRADLLQAQGLYPPPSGVSDILGLEIAGIISAVGQGVKTWKIGDRILALVPGGGYAEQAVVHHQMLLPLPPDWSFAQGAAIPEVWLTAFSNLFIEGNLQPGERVLLHAGGSGVGTAGIHLAHAHGAVVFVTAGTASKLAACRELGADLAINYKQQDFLAEIREASQEKGVDLILDPVGGAYLDRNLQALAENGRLVNIGFLGGANAEMNMGLVLGKSLKIIGSRLRSRPLAQKIDLTNQFQKRFWPLLESGKLMPVIDTVFPIQSADDAHNHVRQNLNTGKVILEVESNY